VRHFTDPDLLVGAATGDDAAVWRLDDDRALVVTADFITPVVDDARWWGRVAAANAVSDVYAMGEKEREELGIEQLPGSLNEAIAMMGESRLVREALGDHIFDKFIQNKKIEWDAYRSQVHRYELERYLSVL